MAKTKIVWAPSAIGRLEEIADYIVNEGTPLRAAEFTERLLEATDQLVNFLLSGAICPENPVCRQLVVDGYRIIYEPSEATADIVAIIAPGQDAMAVLLGRNKK